MRPTTEQGGRFERCNFTFGFSNEVTPTGSPTSDSIQLISGQSMIASMVQAGTQAANVARMLQNPLRDFEVLALVLDIDAILGSGVATADPSADFIEQTVHAGFAIYTQRLDADGAPITLPPYWLSQWPVNLLGSGTSEFQEDRDYATRTHLSRTFTLQPHIAETGEGRVVYPGNIRYRQYVKLRIKRKLGDQYGLFFGAWSSNPGASGIQSDSIQYLIHGSLWYKMKF